MFEKEILVEVLECLKENKKEIFQELIQELQPYDIQHLYTELPNEYRQIYLEFLGKEWLIDLIQELDNESRLDVLKRLRTTSVSYILNKMDKDDLAVLLQSLPSEQATEFLEKMNQKESETVQTILTYPPESAGRIMTDKFIWITKESTVQETIAKMRIYASFSETINYLYVVNQDRQLVGVVSHRDLILASAEERIEEIMFQRILTVHVLTDQEEVANMIGKYDFLALPVVDDENRLLGIITVDDALDVLMKEADEDIEKLSASGRDIDFDTKAISATMKRLPWLIMLLFIGLFTGGIMSGFEETIQQVVALTYFIPMIAGMTGNTGTQSLALTVRGLSKADLKINMLWKLIARELVVGICIGLVCGVIICFIGYVWQGDWMLGLVVGVSLFLTLIIGTLAGTIIPILLHKCGVDPAVASGPLITTLNDIFSLFVYLGLATLLMVQL